MRVKDRVAVGLLSLALAGSAVVHALAAVGPFDDAFITFRYVENLLGGRGAVYNPGERVLGVSCPLYAAWLAAERLVLPGVGLPALAVRGNALFLSAAGLLIVPLMRRGGFSLAASAVTGAGVILSEGVLRGSIGGMESSLFLALVFGALLAVARASDTTAFLLASLASLTRPEGLILLVVVVAIRYLDAETRRLSARPLLGLLPLVVWIVAATAYYGTPIPHSVIAKARPLYPLPAGAALGYLAAQAGRWTLDGPAALALTFASGLSPSIPRALYQTAGLALTSWALVRWARVPGAPRALALPAFVSLLSIFYAVSNPLLLPWYLPLVQAPWIVLGLAAGFSREGWMVRPRAARWTVVSLILATSFASFIHHVGPSDRSLVRYGGTDARQAAQLDAYDRTARWVGEHSRGSDSVAAPEIGRLGFHLDRRILDACGLVTPEAIPFLPVPPEQRGAQLGPISVEFVQATKPDFVVTLPAFAERSLLRSDWFSTAYLLIHKEPFLPGEPRYGAVLVFQRRDGGALR